MQTVLITGGTGITGSRLSEFLVANGFRVIILTRNASHRLAPNGIRYAHWDVEKQTIDADVLAEVDHIIHLAGAGVVDRPWTAAYRQLIADSRIHSISLLYQALQKQSHQVKSFMSASAIGWYGADATPPIPFVETAPADKGFLGDTCRLWENEALKMETLGIRVGILRTGIVLSENGGALKEFMRPLHFGVAAIIGNGKQVVSWIHIDDLCRMYLYLIQNSELKGIFNAVAPHPVSNKTLTQSLAAIMRPGFHIKVPVPALVLKIMMGARSIEVLKSTTVSSKKIEQSGYQFLFPEIKMALQHLLKKD